MRVDPFAQEDYLCEERRLDGSNKSGLIVDVCEHPDVRCLGLQLAKDRTVFERDR